MCSDVIMFTMLWVASNHEFHENLNPSKLNTCNVLFYDCKGNDDGA